MLARKLIAADLLLSGGGMFGDEYVFSSYHRGITEAEGWFMTYIFSVIVKVFLP